MVELDGLWMSLMKGLTRMSPVADLWRMPIFYLKKNIWFLQEMYDWRGWN